MSLPHQISKSACEIKKRGVEKQQQTVAIPIKPCVSDFSASLCHLKLPLSSDQ